MGKLKLDLNLYDRVFDNYADDDVLFDTGVSFPIAFRRGAIHGIEAKLDLPNWGRLSGQASYSNMVGFGYTPVTGGLFLGDEASDALANSGRFAVSQDQRNTIQHPLSLSGCVARLGSFRRSLRQRPAH